MFYWKTLFRIVNIIIKNNPIEAIKESTRGALSLQNRFGEYNKEEEKIFNLNNSIKNLLEGLESNITEKTEQSDEN